MRRRVWPLATTLELCVRYSEFHQSGAAIARALPNLTYMQVIYYLQNESTTLGADQPPAVQAMLEEIRTRVAAEVASSVDANGIKLVGGPRTHATPLTPEELTALDTEVAGCVDLVRQAASQFGITPQRFLALCRKAV